MDGHVDGDTAAAPSERTGEGLTILVADRSTDPSSDFTTAVTWMAVG